MQTLKQRLGCLKEEWYPHWMPSFLSGCTFAWTKEAEYPYELKVGFNQYWWVAVFSVENEPPLWRGAAASPTELRKLLLCYIEEHIEEREGWYEI